MKFTTEEIEKILEQAMNNCLRPEDEENEIVKRAIACLPEPYNSTLTLHYLTDKTPKEVSALLGVSLSAVYGRIYEGKRKLIAYLKEEGVNVDEYFCIE